MLDSITGTDNEYNNMEKVNSIVYLSREGKWKQMKLNGKKERIKKRNIKEERKSP